MRAVRAREERLLVGPAIIRRRRSTRDFTLASGVFFAFTALPVFWTWMVIPNALPMRVILRILTPPAGWIMRLTRR